MVHPTPWRRLHNSPTIVDADGSLVCSVSVLKESWSETVDHIVSCVNMNDLLRAAKSMSDQENQILREQIAELDKLCEKLKEAL